MISMYTLGDKLVKTLKNFSLPSNAGGFELSDVSISIIPPQIHLLQKYLVTK